MDGGKLSEIYEQAGYSANGPGWTDDNKAAASKKVLERPHVQAYIEEMQKALKNKTLWTREKALRKLIKITDNTEDNVMFSGTAVNAIKEANKMCGFDKPEEVASNTESKPYLIPAKDIAKSFVDVNRDIDNRKYLEYWFNGGRGSTKSTFISEKIVELLKNNPKMCAIAIRRVGNTLKDSVYSQIEWAIDLAGLTAEFKNIKSPMEITLKETGQKIYFRGLDDAGKLKSIKPPPGMYLGIEWYEEADQVQGIETMRKIDQSIIRGGEDFVKFVSYNTPISKLHWINQEALKPKSNRLIHHSNYLDVPKDWLGQIFFDEAQYLKETNITAYQHEYMGEAVGTGLNVFENIELRTITDEEISHFDTIYMGIDWGWFPDPFHWGKMYYNHNQRKLYIFDEYRTNKTKNADAWAYLVNEKGVTTSDLIICDSAEPKSIGDFRSYGAMARAAEKGPNSVHEGIKWLQSLNAIIIDCNRCPFTAEEFSLYEYEKTPEGEPITAYPDENNHSIDMVRYALERVWKKRGN